MNEIVAQLRNAARLHSQGQLAQAAAIYREIISRDAAQPDALHLLGVALTQSGEHASGIEYIRRSLHINPAQPVAYANLGNAEYAMASIGAALASYDRSISLRADYPPAHNGRGNALLALNDFQGALASFERAVALMPGFTEALAHRGMALLKLERIEEAIDAFSSALATRPNEARLLARRASALCLRWRYSEALADCERALRLQPALLEARYARWSAMMGLRQFDSVVAEIDALPQGAADDPEIVLLRANAQRQLGRANDAVASYERALVLRPDFADALLSLATLHVAERRYDQAAAAFERLLAIAPDYDFARGACLNAKLQIFDWNDFEQSAQRIIADMDGRKKVDLPLTFLSISDDPELQWRCAMTHAQTLPKTRAPNFPKRVMGHDRIRVAYISADFLEHPMAYLLAGLFEAHDRTRFEVFAISYRSDPRSPMAARLRGAFEHFIDVGERSDGEIAELIHALEIDIAVDLMGYTAEERPGVLVRRPASLQVSYIGFPATMGADHMDYIVADPYVIPPASAPYFSEQVVRLPECFQANDSRRISGPRTVTRAEAGLPEDAFVWCAFHASFKINPPLFDIWARLLRTQPNSVLWLISNTALAELNLRRAAARRGIEPERLIFAKREPYPQHLARLALADLCLDTWPFNGGATTSDALWSGVPVVTRSGRAFASRMSGSLLGAVGLSELATESFADYEQLALSLASDGGALAAVRALLKEGRATGALFDTDRFRRRLESAYVRMWQRHERGEAAESFDVATGDASGLSLRSRP
jgi:predicted O-linked N-acetylglucosamine transferase (SPINDLY family)